MLRVFRWWMADADDRRLTSPGYQLFMLVLCVFALAIMLLEMVFRAEPELLRILDYADTAICVFFLFDFFLSLSRAKDKKRYLMTWGWLDLLSSIPTLDAARWGRVARIARVTRVLRALRASRLLGQTLLRHRGQSAALAAARLALFLIIGSSAAILQFEDPAAANIKSGDDAIWWAFTTITTVGYGDKYPVSPEGRLVAALLMTAGVGLFSAFSAALAAWFLTPEDQPADPELAELRKEIAALREELRLRHPLQ